MSKATLGLNEDGGTQFDRKLIQRIQKLHKQAESAAQVGSLEEADAFMEAVQKTLNKYNLDSSVLSLDLRDLEDPMGSEAEWGVTGRHKMKPVHWAQNLALHVALAHHCACLVSMTSSMVFFYGRQSNRGVAKRMFVYLRDAAERIGWDAYVTEVNRRKKLYGSEKGAGQWRLNWLEGFVHEVGQRYERMRIKADSDTGMALVLTSVRKEAEAFANDKAYKGKKKGKRIKTVTFAMYEARQRGADAAKDVSLTPGHIRDGEDETSRRLLDAGAG